MGPSSSTIVGRVSIFVNVKRHFHGGRTITDWKIGKRSMDENWRHSDFGILVLYFLLQKEHSIDVERIARKKTFPKGCNSDHNWPFLPGP